MELQQRQPSLKALCSIMFAVGLGGALAGCNSGTAPEVTVTVTAPPDTVSVPPAATASTTATIPGTGPATEAPTETGESLARLIRAGETAMQAAPGVVTEIETARDGQAWEVTLLGDDHKIIETYIDAEGGTVLSGPTVKRVGSVQIKRYRENIEAAKFDYAEAAAAVVKAVPGGSIREPGIDSTRGGPTWEAEVRDGKVTREIYLDAVTGEVIRNVVDD